MTTEGVLVTFIVLWFFTFMWGLFYYSKCSSLKDAFVDVNMHMNKFISVYVSVAKHNRKIVKRYNAFKAAVREDFFSKILTYEEVIAFYNKHDIPQGDLTDENSNEGLVDKSILDARTNTRHWKELFS